METFKNPHKVYGMPKNPKKRATLLRENEIRKYLSQEKTFNVNRK